jgi:hypothetical protein
LGFCDISRFQSRLSREPTKIKIMTLFRWNRLAILSRIDLIRIFRVLFWITIRKRPPEKGGFSVRLSGRLLVNKDACISCYHVKFMLGKGEHY